MIMSEITDDSNELLKILNNCTKLDDWYSKEKEKLEKYLVDCKGKKLT